MSKRLFVVEVSAHWSGELVVYAEDEKQAREIAELEADPSYDITPQAEAVTPLDNADGLPFGFTILDEPAGHKGDTIGEILHPEPPEPDPTEPPQTYNIRLRDGWMKVPGWRVRPDVPGLDDIHLFIHHHLHINNELNPKAWTVSEVTTGLNAGGGAFRTRAAAITEFANRIAMNDNVAKLHEIIAKTKGTSNESPEYPGRTP